MRMNSFLKSVTVVVILTFMYSNFVWADGSCGVSYARSADKLAASPQVANIGRTLAKHPAGARLLAGEVVVEGLGIDSLSDIVTNIQALTEEGVKCFVGRDTDGNTAKYIIEDGAILRKTLKDKEVKDKFYRALQLLGIEGKTETLDTETREYIYVTEQNVKFINSVLVLISNNNPEWVVAAVKVVSQLASAPVNEPNLVTNQTVSSAKPNNQEGFSTIGAMFMTAVLSGVGYLVYTYKSQIWAWMAFNHIHRNLIYVAGSLLAIGLYFVIWRVVFPVSWYMWRLKNYDSNIRKNAAERLGGLGDKSAIGLLLEKLGNGDLFVRDALEKLGATKNQLVDGYIKALKGANIHARREAAFVLGELGDKRAVKSLQKLLGDSDEVVRANARDALEKLGEIKKVREVFSIRLRPVQPAKPSAYTQQPTGKEELIAKMGIDHNGKLDVVSLLTSEPVDESTSLTKFAEILGVNTDDVLAVVQKKLQKILDELKKNPDYGTGIFGAVKEVVLVDNLGGLDSDIKENALAVIQNGVIAIDIDAFRSDVVLKDVIEHELWHSILETVELNPAIAEATAIYQNLKVFSEMPDPEQRALITFLMQANNGLQSQRYAELLQNIIDKKVNPIRADVPIGIGTTSNGARDDALIALAISYVVNEPRYSHLVDSLNGILDSDIRKAEEKLGLARDIYQDIAKAVSGLSPVITKVKQADTKSKILMKIKMIASRWSVDTGFIDKLKSQGKYVQLGVNELEKNPHMIDWLKRLTAEQQGAFIFKSGSVTSAADFIRKYDVQGVDANDIENRGIARSNIITLLELGALDTSQDMPDNSGLYLPYIYSATGIYLAAQVMLANGDFKSIGDNLVKTTLMVTFGLDDPNDLNALFKGKWPKAFRVSEIINELREAIRQTEVAA